MKFFSISLLIYLFLISVQAELVKMKIVNEVSSYGWNAGPDRSRKLQPKVPPSKFSGPEHFKYFKNKCYTLLETDYKYELCLFDNVTQHERTLRWNPYSGILGMWTEWKIENNTFVAMLMKNGEDCGNQNRQVEVKLTCGHANNLTNVSEPYRCHYVMIFQSPVFCHEDAMLVYPMLNKTLQAQWDELEQDFHNEIITEKGYRHYLQNIFYKAGFVNQPPETKADDKFEGFKSLETCNSKYLELLEENKKLKLRLDKM